MKSMIRAIGALAVLVAGCSGHPETDQSRGDDEEWSVALGATGEAAARDAQEKSSAAEYGQSEEAISTFNLYGRGQSPTKPDTDNQCYGDVPCSVPLDRVLSFKVDVGVPPFEFSHGLSDAIALLNSAYGSNWVVNTSGTRTDERIFFDDNCGTPCPDSQGRCGVLARDEPAGVSGVHNQAGWQYRTIAHDGIRICRRAFEGYINNVLHLSEAARINAWRNLLLHEIGHTIGLAHNPSSAIMASGPCLTCSPEYTLIEQIELLSYDPNG